SRGVSAELPAPERVARQGEVSIVVISYCRQSSSVPCAASNAAGGRLCRDRQSGWKTRSSWSRYTGDAADSPYSGFASSTRAPGGCPAASFPRIPVRRDGRHPGLSRQHREVPALQGLRRAASWPRETKAHCWFLIPLSFPSQVKPPVRPLGYRIKET